MSQFWSGGVHKFQPGNPLGFEAAASEEDHRDVTDEPQFAQNVTAVLAAEHDVQEDEVGFHRRRGPHRERAVSRDEHLVPFAREERVEQFGHFGVVINDQDLGQISPSTFSTKFVTKT